MPAHRRSIAVAAVAVLCLLPFALVLAAEIAAHVGIGLAYGVPGHSYGIYEGHPTLKGILSPSSYNLEGKVINNARFQRRGETTDAAPPGAVRVIAYGGSTTFAHNLATGEDWPSALEQAAAAGGTRLEVLNAGDVSWTLHHALERSRVDLPRLHPDVVMFYEGYNEESNHDGLVEEGIDFDARVRAGAFGMFTVRLPQCNWLYRNSLLAKALYRLPLLPVEGVDYYDAPPNEPVDPAPLQLEHFLRTLGKAVDLWSSSGARVVYVIQALGNKERHNIRRIAFSRHGADVARKHGALVVDAQEVAKPELFISTGIHWTQAGSRVMGGFVYDSVKKLGGWTSPVANSRR